MAKKGEDISGWLIIDKPKNIGSTQVVGKVRYIFHAKKAGHAGTLDPFATGLLPIAFGEATKLIDFVMNGDKEYEFTIFWGAETSSSDTEGEIISETNKIPSPEEIRNILPQFIGKIKQTPPIYSAIKINGQRAYDLARKGIEVEIPEREIEVYSLDYLGDLSDNQSKFKVSCSKGTYVRSLGRDIARALGTIGYLTELRRTKCGIFELSDKISLENLENMVYGEHLKEILLPIEVSLRDIAVLTVGELEATKLKQGQSLSPKVMEGKLPLNTLAAAMSKNGLVAIVRIEERKISPIRVFNL